VAALTAITPVVTGVADAGLAVSASDTIDQATLGARGAYLGITNAGGSSDTVTISDFGTTSAGNALPSNTYTVTVANGTSKIIFIKPSQVNPTTGLVTVAHSFTTSVTYQLYPVQ
jgi:hypothetical protein